MNTYPLKSISLEQATKLQFKVVDCITNHFDGQEIITRGDLGVTPGLNQPLTTSKAEKVIAEVFDAENSILVRGAGTNAIRYALFATIKPGETLLIHKAPIYNTTKTTIDMMGLKLVTADFNDIEELKKVICDNNDIKCALVQYTRQSIDDNYDIKEVIDTIKTNKNIKVVTDDNYAVMKVEKIGSQNGADLSCFSCFKLLGPEGVGCVVGANEDIKFIKSHHYSGGCQVQGHEALDVLRGLTYAPVSLAIQANVTENLKERLNNKELKGIKKAYIANAQSKVLLVEFEEEIAKEVLLQAKKMGAAQNPIGAESKYEIAPMFYRVSGTFRAMDSKIEEKMIRINPMRAGEETVMRILKSAIEKVI